MSQGKTGESKTISESVASAKDSEVGRYVQAAHIVKAALIETIKELKKRRRRAKIADKPWYTSAISELRAEFAEVQRDLLAYLDEQLSIAPPTTADFMQIKKMATDLDKLIANAKASKSLLIAATKLADGLQEWA